MKNLIEIKNVSKTFEKSFYSTGKTILKNINLTVQPGEFVVLRGDNGSGKTTLLNLILGLIKPSSGQVELMGIESKNSESKSRVGVVLQETQFPKHLTVRELLDLFRGYYPNSISTEKALDRVSLTDKQNSYAISLSGGQKQRLLFALALIGNPQLLILDEPTRNLDEDGYEEFWQQISRCKEQGITILMVTNNQSDWQQLNSLATRYITLKKFSEDLEGDQIEIEDSNVPVSLVSHSNINADQPTSSNNAFFAQLWCEVLQIFRTPLYLLGIVFPVFFMLFIPKGNSDPEIYTKALVLIISALLLTLFSFQSANQISIERSEGWLKLLRASPLSSINYLGSKLVISLLICLGVVSLALITGSSRIGFSFDLNQWMSLFIAFLLTAIPLFGLSLTISYSFKPKNVNTMILISLIMIIGISGLFPVDNFLVETAMVFSPIYHAQSLILSTINVNTGGQYSDPLLHLIWLLWASAIFMSLAVWAYQRDSVIE